MNTCKFLSKVFKGDANIIYSGIIPYIKNDSVLLSDSYNNICLAVWDTGATMTTVSERLVEKYKLSRIGTGKDTNTANGIIQSPPLYKISLRLIEGDIYIEDLIVTSAPLQEYVDIAIGMDVIAQGDFSLTRKNNQIIFSFCYPSEDSIDYNNV